MQLWPLHHGPGVSGFLTDPGSLYALTGGFLCTPQAP